MSGPEKAEAHAGGGSHKSSKLGMAWGFAILFIVLVMSGVIGALGSELGVFFSNITNSIGNFFQMLRINAGILMQFIAIGLVAAAIFIGFKKK